MTHNTGNTVTDGTNQATLDYWGSERLALASLATLRVYRMR
jgi:hypothetical protein